MTRIPQNPETCHRPYGELLVSVLPGRLIISEVGLSETEGLASAALAERLRPELDALDAAVRNRGVR